MERAGSDSQPAVGHPHGLRSLALRKVIMDKGAIFLEVTERNALRLANCLPPLNIPAEYAHAVAIERDRELRSFRDEHAADRIRIREPFWPSFGRSMVQLLGTRWVGTGRSGASRRSVLLRTWKSNLAFPPPATLVVTRLLP